MKKIVYTLCITSMLIGGGCKKTQPDVPYLSRPMIAIIKQPYIEGPLSLYQDFTYNEVNNVKEIKALGGGATTGVLKYTYVGSIVQQRSIVNDKELPNDAVNYKLNEQGLVQEKDSPYQGFRLMYEYDGHKFIIRINSYTKGVLTSYFMYSYSGNNLLDSISAYEPDGVKAYVNVYTYLAGQNNTIGNENKGQEMFGKDQQLLVKRETRFVYNYPGAEGKRIKLAEDDFNYTFDSRGRVLTLTDTRTLYSYPGNRTDFYIAAAFEYIYK